MIDLNAIAGTLGATFGAVPEVFLNSVAVSPRPHRILKGTVRALEPDHSMAIALAFGCKPARLFRIPRTAGRQRRNFDIRQF